MPKMTIPPRSEVKDGDKWNLTGLFASEAAWETALVEYQKKAEKIPSFKGTLGTSSDNLYAAMVFFRELGILEETLLSYASLRQTEDEGLAASRDRMGRAMMAYTKAQGYFSFVKPEIMGISDAVMQGILKEERMGEFKVYLNKILRNKSHVLSEGEERLLALQAEVNSTAQEGFSVLSNVDLDFGSIDTKEGKRPLSNGTFASFLQHPDRDVRKRAYFQYYGAFDAHKNTIASLYSGSVQVDRYQALVRNFKSSRASALFPDNVDETVYDNLVSTVNANLGTLHEYYGLRKKALKVSDLRHYDVYAPLVGEADVKHSYTEAVDVIVKALAPLGSEYCDTLSNGLLNGWVDRYENKGKRSGAFSAGGFVGEPYILMNYNEDVLRDVFTLAHEGGHSMHSYYSAKSNPFMHYNYTIFEAEVASTFNEQLLFEYMYKNAKDKTTKAYLVNKKLDDLLATLYRQTMFAEYEAKTHALLEGGTPLTVDVLRSTYRELLVKYFGPEMVFEDLSDLEGLRIPHFYNAFYVYKYATGVSASTALAKRVLSGGAKERDDYFAFLKSGGSRFPIDALKVAGVDMSKPEAVQDACAEFKRLVGEFKSLIL